MTRQRFLWIASLGMVVAWSANMAQAGGVVISSHSGPRTVAVAHSGIGVGVWIGRPPVPHVRPYRPVVISSPRHRRFVRIHPPYHRTVVVRHPAVRHPVVRPVVVQPAPPVVVKAPVCETSVTIWITNSNGSRTSVRLTRQGHWYVGPRGEYYETLPTNEQLRAIYGF